MEIMNKFPLVMQNARTDLSANVSGQFSPNDWELILNRAFEKFKFQKTAIDDDLRAWQAVMLDFYHNNYWGFSPHYRPQKVKRARPNYALYFIAIGVFSMTALKMIVAWLGQIYTSSDSPRAGYIFYSVLAFIVMGFAFFLWQVRDYED